MRLRSMRATTTKVAAATAHSAIASITVAAPNSGTDIGFASVTPN